MSWWSRFWGPKDELPASLTQGYALTAAAAVRGSRDRVTPSYETWQAELWDFYENLGEFRFAVMWKSEMISRVRLNAGRMVPGQDEPEVVESGPAVDLISEIGGSIGGQAEMLESLSVQLDVPGEGYVVGETVGGVNVWQARSVDEVRMHNGRYEVLDENSPSDRERWRPLGRNSMVVRVWRPHKRKRHLADSPARAARDTMRELELVNRYIQSQYLSRLASAGLLVLPDEIAFPVRPEFQDANDPFVLEWIETAREGIKEPGTASAIVPIPMRVPAEYADKIQHIDFTLKIDERIIEKRDSAIRRLASQVDVPPEVLLGMSGLNHWAAWQVEESAIKTHISPTIELICHALTIGYLHPRLKAMGEDPTGIVVWYDTSELTFRPDRSDNAIKAYDRGELSGRALRRETGFDEADAPTREELEGIGLRMLMRNPQVGFLALSKLTGLNVDDLMPEPEAPDPEDANEVRDERRDEEADGGPPDNRDESPPPPGPDATAHLGTPSAVSWAKAQEQAVAMHRITFDIDRWTLRHPPVCRDAIMTCPVTEASRYLAYHPGTSGHYECWLSEQGDLRVGRQVFDVTPRNFIKGHTRRLKRKSLVNGKRR